MKCLLASSARVSTGEAIAFCILGPVALAGAIAWSSARNAVHSALSLVATMMCLGLFYVIEQGPFLGLVQIIVYTGAIIILFLFVLMLVGRENGRLSRGDSARPASRGNAGRAWPSRCWWALSIGRAFTNQAGEQPGRP